jgi:hypothetical protein
MFPFSYMSMKVLVGGLADRLVRWSLQGMSAWIPGDVAMVS